MHFARTTTAASAALLCIAALGCTLTSPVEDADKKAPDDSPAGTTGSMSGGGTDPSGGQGGDAVTSSTSGAGGDGGTIDPMPDGVYPTGTELVTTAELNLRDGPSTDNAILTVMPSDSRVVVVDGAGSAEWVHVKYLFEDAIGFAHVDYLALAPAPIDPEYDSWRAEVLAKKAVALWSGSGSGDLCLYGVDTSCKQSGIDPGGSNCWPVLPSAIDWGYWANDHPAEMAAHGFKRVDVDVNAVPQGSVIVWQPGQCGYHSLYGHIEIVVDHGSSTACSDFCGNVAKNCGNPWTWIPTKLP